MDGDSKGLTGDQTDAETGDQTGTQADDQTGAQVADQTDDESGDQVQCIEVIDYTQDFTEIQQYQQIGIAMLCAIFGAMLALIILSTLRRFL